MVERFPHKNRSENIVASNPLHEYITVSSKSAFKELLLDLKANVTIGDLLEDRLAQAKLDVLLDIYAERSERADNLPVIILKAQRDGRGAYPTSIESSRFALQDEHYLYYFNKIHPQESIPSYLRTEDVIDVKEYDDERREITKAFNKPINRVSVSGGKAERFNYNKGEWEKNDDGFFAGVNSRNVRHDSSFSIKRY